MEQKTWWRIILFFIIVGIIGYFVFEQRREINSTQNIQYIQYLENQLDCLKNIEREVDLQIDTVIVEIEKEKIRYEKERNIIFNNTPNEDYKFFTDYINSNRERLYSNFNRRTENN